MATDLWLLLGEGKASFLVPIQDTAINEVLRQALGLVKICRLVGESGLEACVILHLLLHLVVLGDLLLDLIGLFLGLHLFFLDLLLGPSSFSSCFHQVV